MRWMRTGMGAVTQTTKSRGLRFDGAVRVFVGTAIDVVDDVVELVAH